MQSLRAAWCERVLCWAVPRPRFAACLVAGGTLAAILEGVSGAEGLEPPEQWRVLERGAHLLAAVADAAAREPAAQQGTSPCASQAAADLDVTTEELQRLCANGMATQGHAVQLRAALQRALPAAAQVAAALQVHWQRADAAPERQQAAQLELAQAAATRASCAHLACPNVGATGRRGKLCTGCRVAHYCCRACSEADWRAGHRAACRQLATGRGAGAAAEEAAA